MWSSGDVALLRYVDDGRVSRLHPVTVVEDSERAVALFLAAGTPIKVRHGLDGHEIPRSLSYTERWSQPWTLGDGRWSQWQTLMLTPNGAGHSFWAVWDTNWRLHEWYVNLQQPLRRTGLGFDTADETLDIVIAPDLSRWEWKDEDELAEAVRLGRYTDEDARRIRREGDRALSSLTAREWPFDRDWSVWRPDPAWVTPTIPEGWDVV